MHDASRPGISGEIQLSALIADLWWRIDLMNSDVLEEEAKAKVFDIREPTYPMIALNLRARRDNLVSTIGVLEQRARSA
jgi:hypothetical protein